MTPGKLLASGLLSSRELEGLREYNMPRPLDLSSFEMSPGVGSGVGWVGPQKDSEWTRLRQGKALALLSAPAPAPASASCATVPALRALRAEPEAWESTCSKRTGWMESEDHGL